MEKNNFSTDRGALYVTFLLGLVVGTCRGYQGRNFRFVIILPVAGTAKVSEQFFTRISSLQGGETQFIVHILGVNN